MPDPTIDNTRFIAEIPRANFCEITNCSDAAVAIVASVEYVWLNLCASHAVFRLALENSVG